MAARVIISGGGTGGHIFPAVSIANALKELDEHIEILFVGANGKMEMEKVPAAGYKIIGLDIQGINRTNLLKNIFLPFKLFKSMMKARKIVKDFKPDVAVGVGGYASGPLLMVANNLHIPTLIQEQNSYAGVTNKRLATKAKVICVAYEGMDKFFPSSKILMTGNPIRKSSVDIQGKKSEACAFFGLQEDLPTILIVGGSLGARKLNESIVAYLNEIGQQSVQVIWQCGSYYEQKLKAELEGKLPAHVKMFSFLARMDYAYAAADVIISRAGAGTISELCVIGKPVILVPSPNVAEDHQTKNAMALVKDDAAVLIKDNEAVDTLLPTAFELLKNKTKMQSLGEQIQKMAHPDADMVIAKEVLKLIKK